MLQYIGFLLLLLFSVLSYSQTQIGEWRDHFSYNNILGIAEGDQKVFAATNESLFSINLIDNSIERINKLNGLSEIGISTIKYHKQSNTLIIGYSNGNIDLLIGSKIISLPDILRSSIIGDKTIYHIDVVNDQAFLSTGFGIVVLDIVDQEFDDTYIIGPNASQLKINATAQTDQEIFAATDKGIYKANLNGSLLSDFNSWSKDSSTPNANGTFNVISEFKGSIVSNLQTNVGNDTLYIYNGTSWAQPNTYIPRDIVYLEKSQGKLIACTNFSTMIFEEPTLEISFQFTYNTTLPLDYSSTPPEPHFMILQCATIDSDGNYWSGDRRFGLLKNIGSNDASFYSPEGPATNAVRKMALLENKLWSVPGTVTSTNWSGQFNIDGISSFNAEIWSALDRYNTIGLDTIMDIISVVIDSNTTSKAYVGSWSEGILELNGNQIVNHYYKDNSGLEGRILNNDLVGVSDMAFDETGNLWILNPATLNPLKVLKSNGDWEGYNFSFIDDNDILTELLIDDNGYKWMIEKDKGIVVLNDKGTFSATDDESKLLTQNNAGLPSNTIYSFAKDLDGEIWTGTSEGIAIFYNPKSIFSNNNFNAQQILIEQDGNIEILMKNEIVTAIAVDGANRKWLGTATGGVFLMSEDGTEQVFNFTEENSPLISNEINDIVINHNTGEVFFGTSEGIVSFKSTATEPQTFINQLFIYPNPIKPNYTGSIAIKGLMRNTNIKITDGYGNLIFETISEGGQAIWNGKKFNGETVNTGVYYVYATTTDGTQTGVGKILFHR